jgi:hypothetical protein
MKKAFKFVATRRIYEEFSAFIKSMGELGFDLALPAYSQLRIDGFSKKDIIMFCKNLKNTDC